MQRRAGGVSRRVDQLEDHRDELTERGLAGSTLNQRRAVLSGVFKLARRRFKVNVDPMDIFYARLFAAAPLPGPREARRRTPRAPAI